MIPDPLQQLTRDYITVRLLCASCYIANAASTAQFTHDVSAVYTKKLYLNGEEWTVLERLSKRISRLRPQFGDNGRQFPLLCNPPCSFCDESLPGESLRGDVVSTSITWSRATRILFLFHKVKTSLKCRIFRNVEDMKMNLTAKIIAVHLDASMTSVKMPIVVQLTHWGRGHLNCLNARYRGF